MFGIGTSELIIIFLVALIVLGPKKLPEIARTLAKVLREFRRVLTSLEDEINTPAEDVRDSSASPHAQEPETPPIENPPSTPSPPDSAGCGKKDSAEEHPHD
jgi:sec-independent protein translocase protein TatB